jgi:hypothetical protein
MYFMKHEIENKFGSFATELLEREAWKDFEIVVDGEVVKAYERTLHFCYFDEHHVIMREVKCDKWLLNRYRFAVE